MKWIHRLLAHANVRWTFFIHVSKQNEMIRWKWHMSRSQSPNYQDLGECARKIILTTIVNSNRKWKYWLDRVFPLQFSLFSLHRFVKFIIRFHQFYVNSESKKNYHKSKISGHSGFGGKQVTIESNCEHLNSLIN